MQVRNRKGKLVEFNKKRIEDAITRAFICCGYKEEEIPLRELISNLPIWDEMSIESISDSIEEVLMDYDYHAVAKAFILYRERQRAKREAIEDLDEEIAGIASGDNIEAINENSNKDAKLNATQRDLMLGTYSRGYAIRHLLPKDLVEAHNKGWIHFHDLDYALTRRMFNCCLINLKDMLGNGTVINGKKISSPKSILTACTVASQIVLQCSNNQYGGLTFNIAHLAPFVRVSYNKWYVKYKEELGTLISEDKLCELVQKRTQEDVDSGIQTLQYQLNTFSSLNGQSPFVSIFMKIDDEPEYEAETVQLIESILRLRWEGMENEFGVKSTPAFPKLLFVTDENNVYPDSKYYWLKKLAIKVTARRMNPDFISAKMMREYYKNNVYGCMGCRSFLAPWMDDKGNYKFWGRFNKGVVSLNLPDVALSSHGDIDKFWKILDERLTICKEALLVRTSWLRGAVSDVSPIHWQYGAIARLKKGEPIDKYLDGGYSSISLGYIGLHETVKYLTGNTLNSKEGHDLGMSIMKYLHKTTDEWKMSNCGLDGCALYGSPAESLCYRFARTLKERFGEVAGITNKQWITNSYHIDVNQPIDAFEKLKVESEFQKESLGGAISYVEIPNMENNLEALEQIVDFMYNNLIYAEINTRAGDSCGTCGFTGEMATDEHNEWYCPQCGERDHSKLTVVRRTCG